jgi:hypothetical protein
MQAICDVRAAINTCLPHAPPAGLGHHWPWYRLPGPMAFSGAGRAVAVETRGRPLFSVPSTRLPTHRARSPDRALHVSACVFDAPVAKSSNGGARRRRLSGIRQQSMLHLGCHRPRRQATQHAQACRSRALARRNTGCAASPGRDDSIAVRRDGSAAIRGRTQRPARAAASDRQQSG